MAVSGEDLWQQTSAGKGGMSRSMSEGKGPNPLNKAQPGKFWFGTEVPFCTCSGPWKPEVSISV